MIQQSIHRQSGLSYIPAPRYAGGMIDFHLTQPMEPGFVEGYTRRHIGMARPAFFCRLQPKVTENKNLHDCKDDRTQI
jgi:hypothetical protein